MEPDKRYFDLHKLAAGLGLLRLRLSNYERVDIREDWDDETLPPDSDERYNPFAYLPDDASPAEVAIAVGRYVCDEVSYVWPDLDPEARKLPSVRDAAIATTGVGNTLAQCYVPAKMALVDGYPDDAVAIVSRAFLSAFEDYGHALQQCENVISVDAADYLTTAVTTAKKPKPGRPRESDPDKDKWLHDQWVAIRDAGQITTYAEAAREIGVAEHVLRAAYGRHRKALTRK